MKEELRDMEEGIVKQKHCYYCSQLDCINVVAISDIGVDLVAKFCALCLRARLVREIKLLRITGHQHRDGDHG